MLKESVSFYRYFPAAPRDRQWGFFIDTVGTSRIAPGAAYPPRGHPEGYDFDWAHGRVLQRYHLVYISKGRGWFESERTRRQMVEAGSIFMLFPGIWHRYMPEPSSGWTEHWVGFDGSIPRRWIRQGFFSPASPMLRPGREDLLLPLFNGMIEAVKQDMPALQQVLAGMASQLIGLLYSSRQASLTGDEASRSVIRKALQRFQENLDRPFNLRILARDLGVSYSWFRRTFTQHTGSSPHHYLLELRLARARNLLSESTLTIKEIARLAGFQDEHYFSRIFRANMRTTPSNWRARSRR